MRGLVTSDRDRVDRQASRVHSARTTAWATLALFVAGLVVNLVLVTQRTLWVDEAASISASTRALTGPTGLLELVRHLDLVHFANYVLLHFWFDLVGYSPFALRAPSAIAVAAASALMVPLGVRMVGLRFGVLAASILLATPSSLVNATNGRSQALELLVAVATTLLLVTLLDNDDGIIYNRRVMLPWSAYGLLMYLGILFNLWFVFLVIAHGFALGLAIMKTRISGRARLAGVVTMAIVATATVPFALAAISQKGQLSYYKPVGPADALVVFFRDTSFSGTLVSQDLLWPGVAASVSWSLATVGAVCLFRKRRTILSVVIPWLLFPVVGLYAVSVLVTPIFASRFLVMSTPALALLVAGGVEVLLSRRLAPVAVGALLALMVFGAYSWHLVRFGEPFGADFVVAAREVRDTQAAQPERSSGLILGKLRRDPVQMLFDYPQEFEGLDDLTGTPPPPPDFFWSPRPPIEGALERAATYQRIWYLGRESGAETKLVVATLTGEGFKPVEVTAFRRGTLIRFEQ